MKCCVCRAIVSAILSGSGDRDALLNILTAEFAARGWSADKVFEFGGDGRLRDDLGGALKNIPPARVAPGK
jgi:hypothetical protein